MTRTRPNVLLVIADQWRAQSIGYAGDSNVDTPHLDRFAAESLNFTQAVSGTPVCSPARASLLTGQYPITHGVYINDVELRPTVKTLAEVYADAGYRTGYVGKWHLHGSPDGAYGRRQSYIPPDKRFGFQYWKVGECTHDYNNSFYYEADDRTKRYWPGYDAFAQTEDVANFIRKRADADEPYFMVLSYGPPHFPLETAPEEYRRRYRDRDIALRPNVPAADADEATQALRGYYAHMAALDDCFAQLLATLDETGTADDTIVIFTSDHGDMMGSQGMPAKQKLVPWDESVRIPFLLRYPRRADLAGRASGALVNMPDVMPTLLGLCGLPVPAGVQGTDHLSDNRQPILPTDSALLSMVVPFSNVRERGIAEYRGVRSSRFTYVESRLGPWLLYDNLSDPYQMCNLCDDPGSRPIRDALAADLRAWLAALGDEFLPYEHYVERDGLGHYNEVRMPVGAVASPWGDWEPTLLPS